MEAAARGWCSAQIKGRITLGRVQKSGGEIGGESESDEARDGFRTGAKESSSSSRCRRDLQIRKKVKM